MLAKIRFRDGTWNLLNVQHIRIDGVIQTSLVVALKRTEWPKYMVEGDHHLRNRSPPTHPLVWTKDRGFFSIEIKYELSNGWLKALGDVHILVHVERKYSKLTKVNVSGVTIHLANLNQMSVTMKERLIKIYITGLILGFRPVNERRCYVVTTSPISWAQA